MSAQYSFKSIIENLYTKNQATVFLSQLDQLLQEGFMSHTEIFNKIEEILTIEIGSSFRANAAENNIDLANPSQFKSFVVDLKGVIEKLPVMKMYLAVDPPEESLRAISHWFVDNLSKQYLLDIVVRREIIGGAVLVVNGKFRDYSIKQKIHLLYKNKNLLNLTI